MVIHLDKGVQDAADTQRYQALALNNFIAEVRVLSKELPEGDSKLIQLNYQNRLVKSELQKINNVVKEYDNLLRLRLGQDYEGNPFDVIPSFPVEENSEKILNADLDFPPLAKEDSDDKVLSGKDSDSESAESKALRTKEEEEAYRSGKKFDPRFTQLYEMFLHDFRQSVSAEAEEVEKSEADEKAKTKGGEEGDYPLIADIGTIVSVQKDVRRLAPLSNLAKAFRKEAGDKSLILDYEKQENIQSGDSLPDDLRQRFEELVKWKGRIKVKPMKDTYLPPPPGGSYESPREKNMRYQAYEDAKRRRLETELPPHDPGENMYAVSPSGVLRKLDRGESPKEGEEIAYGVERVVCIPRIDTGEDFGGLSNKKRRIFKVALRVINTADIEVGIKGQSFTSVEDLKGCKKTGEF